MGLVNANVTLTNPLQHKPWEGVDTSALHLSIPPQDAETLLGAIPMEDRDARFISARITLAVNPMHPPIISVAKTVI